MNSYTIGTFVGAIIACFLVSRVFHWLAKKFDPIPGSETSESVYWVALATGATTILLAWGGNGSLENWAYYFVASLIVLCFDSFRQKREITNVGSTGENISRPPMNPERKKHLMKIIARWILGIICTFAILVSLEGYSPNYFVACIAFAIGGVSYYSGLRWLYKTLL